MSAAAFSEEVSQPVVSVDYLLMLAVFLCPHESRDAQVEEMWLLVNK